MVHLHDRWVESKKKLGFMCFFTVNLYHEKTNAKCQTFLLQVAIVCFCWSTSLFELKLIRYFSKNCLAAIGWVRGPSHDLFTVAKLPPVGIPFWTMVISCIGLGE